MFVQQDVSFTAVAPVVTDCSCWSEQTREVLQEMKRILMTLTMMAALGSVLAMPAIALSTSPTVAPPPQTAMIPINFTSALGSFAGVFDITRFAVQNGQLNAIGTLTGTVRDAAGGIVGTISQALTLPVIFGPGGTIGSCDILNLVLGPLHLDLLGLVVDLNQVVLNITAQSGAGNLLGNLLCAIAGLLDRGGPLQGLAALLNNLLRVLG